MRLRRREAPQLGVLGALALAATLLSVASGAGGASHEADRATVASAWRGLVGTPRQQVAVGQRVIVVLNSPSLADRVAAAGGTASEAQQRQWTAAALAADNLLIARLAQEGVRDPPRAPLRARADRLLGTARPQRGRAARACAGGRRRLSRPHRLPGLRVVDPDREGEARRGLGVATERLSPGLRRARRDDRAPRHRGRGDASVPARPGRRGYDVVDSDPDAGREREPRGSDPARAAWDADGGAMVGRKGPPA